MWCCGWGCVGVVKGGGTETRWDERREAAGGSEKYCGSGVKEVGERVREEKV